MMFYPSLPSRRPSFVVSISSRALLMAFLVISTAQANDLKYSATMAEHGVWDSNPLMRTTGVEELYGSTTTARLFLGDETPTKTLGLDVSVDENIFNQADFNSTDFYGTLVLVKKMQRTQASLRATGAYDTTRSSEISDLGLATHSVRRLSYSAAPEISYDLSPLSKISLAGAYNKVSYDQNNFIDYHTVTVTPTFTKTMTPKIVGTASLEARRYESDKGTDRRVDSLNPKVGIKFQATEKLMAQFSVGEMASQQTDAGAVTRDWHWDLVFGSSLSYQGDQDSLKFEASRSQQSYANGSDSLLNSLLLNEKHQVNENIALNIGGSYQFSEGAANGGSTLDSTYGGNVGMTYTVTDYLAVVSSYQYRNETLINADKSAERNIVRIGLTFQQKSD